MSVINPLTIDDERTCHVTLATYVISWRNIRFKDRLCTIEKGGMGEVGGQSHDMTYMWWLSW